MEELEEEIKNNKRNKVEEDTDYKKTAVGIVDCKKEDTNKREQGKPKKIVWL